MPLINNVGMTPADPTDYVVEQKLDFRVGSGLHAKLWSYRKWNSGVLECWAAHEVYQDFDSSAPENALGGQLTAAYSAGCYPVFFTDPPVVQVACSCDDSPTDGAHRAIVCCGSMQANYGFAGAPPKVRLLVESSAGKVRAQISYYAIGRWK